jgi:hypothetical protein
MKTCVKQNPESPISAFYEIEIKRYHSSKGLKKVIRRQIYDYNKRGWKLQDLSVQNQKLHLSFIRK